MFGLPVQIGTAVMSSQAHWNGDVENWTLPPSFAVESGTIQ